MLIEIEGQPYILRERPQGPAETDIHFRYAFQQYLQKAGIPLPFYRLTPEGEPFVKIGEDYFRVTAGAVGGELFSTAANVAWSGWLRWQYAGTYSPGITALYGCSVSLAA